MDILKKHVIRLLNENKKIGSFSQKLSENVAMVDHHINEGIKKYHLHNIAWMVNAKLGDNERAEWHMKQGMDHHANALAVYKNGIDVGPEPFSERLQRIKKEVHGRLKDDLT